MRQIILDTETTGLSYEQGHRVIEIGCVELVNRRITGERFHQYINPEREVDSGALAVHGITNEFLSDKPLFTAVVEAFLDFIKDSEVIAHNAPFDIGFLNHELGLAHPHFGKMTDYCKVFDTLKLARQLHPGQRNSLDALTKRYQIDNFNRDLHGALLDAEILAHVYLVMTGGQGVLFSENDAQLDGRASKQESSVQTVHQPTKIIEANQEELAAHEAMLKLIHAQSEGQCLWDE